jgi:hypothetical protein
MDELSTPVIALAIVGLVAFFIYTGVQHVKRKSEERRAALRSLGFEPMAPADRGVLDAVVDLCRRFKGDSYRVDNVLQRKGSDHRLLLFDLHDNSGENHHPGLLAVMSRRLALPRFTLYPRLEMEGRLAAFANTLLEKVVGHQGRMVSFPHHPAFDRRYFVRAQDEDEIHRFLDAERLDALAPKQYLVIEAGGDAFTVDRIRLSGRARGSDLADVAERVEEAEGLLRLFSKRG